MGRVEGKIALVTGAARGIGKAVAEALASQGAQVLLTDRRDELGKAAAVAIGASAAYMHLDVSHEEAWQNAARFLESEYGRVDIVVNNAGILGLEEELGPQDPEHCSLASWHEVHRVNLDGVFLGCKWGIHMMKARGGSIVNISSRSGATGLPRVAAYASSKAAVRNHTKSVALYCAEKANGIRCNAILPGTIFTDMWQPLLKRVERQEFERRIPLRRFGTAAEVAQLALYLACDESAYVTGAEFTIDGGVLAGSTVTLSHRSS